MMDGLAGSPDRAGVFRRGVHGFGHLTPDERVNFMNGLGKMVDVQRIGMRMHAKGLLDHDLYEAGNNATASILRSPGGREHLHLGWTEARKAFERDFFRARLEAHEGRLEDLARELGISRRALHAKMKEHGLSKGRSGEGTGAESPTKGS